MPDWLLIVDPPLSGMLNMQRDRQLYDAFASLPAAGVLRFFRWEQPTLSLGRFQHDPALEARAAALGVPVVRRPTGGQAILHGGDLCWSILAAHEHQSLLATYTRIATVVQAALQRLGIEAGFPPAQDAYRQRAACFASLTSADLEVGGRKLIGSAQLRNRRCFLQQSSVFWQREPAREQALFGPPDGRARIEIRALQPDCQPQDWIRALQAEFQACWELTWLPWCAEWEAAFLAAASCS